MERESREAETEMKTISAAIIKDLGGILSEKCANLFFSLAQSNSCSENPTAASPSVCLCAAFLCLCTAHKSVGNKNRCVKECGRAFGKNRLTAGQFDSCACFWYGERSRTIRNITMPSQAWGGNI